METTDINYATRPVPIGITVQGKEYTGQAVPLPYTCREGVCFALDVTLNGQHLGVISYENGWKMEGVTDQALVDAIGEEIFLWYE